MSTPQEYWDASLIRMWRRDGTLHDLFSMFHSLTGEKARELGLKRLPPFALNGTKSVKVFVAYYLPKINDWLWDKPPERDIDLLRKLSKSNYDTAEKAIKTDFDRELNNERRKIKTNRNRMGMNTLSMTNRNQATDWGVTKGAQSKTGGRSRRYG